MASKKSSDQSDSKKSEDLTLDEVQDRLDEISDRLARLEHLIERVGPGIEEVRSSAKVIREGFEFYDGMMSRPADHGSKYFPFIGKWPIGVFTGGIAEIMSIAC